MSQSAAQSPVPAASRPQIGVIGGSGFYDWFDGAHEVAVETPFGPPSDPIMIGKVAGRQVAFLPRHGRDHRLPPHLVNYRANLWALRVLGVRQVLGPCAVGSLRAELGPGSFVVPDQIVDRTWGRRHTVYDEVGPVAHVAFADPYCPVLRETLVTAAGELGIEHRPAGTMVVIEGPRFSTRAESKMFTQLGGDVIGMTQFPEVVLAREVEICFANVALVTDYDVGVDGIAPVTHAEVLRVFGENLDALRDLLFAAIPRIPHERACPCATALQEGSG